LVGVTAAGDLSADQHKFMVYGSSGVALNSADGGEVDGVLENKPSAAGRSASVAISPSTVKVLSGGSVAKGDLVMSTDAGLAVPATAGKYAAGRALEAVTAANELVTVQLMPFGNV
jgi:hypothetical protein